MLDRVATMMIVRSLREIADELRAIRCELRLTRSDRDPASVPRQPSDSAEIDRAFEILERRGRRKA